MEVADVKYIEQQLKAQFDVQREVYDAEIRCLKEKCKQLQKELDIKDEVDNQIILAYDKDLRRANTKLDRIKEYCNETMRVMNNDTGGNPYAQGRTVEASRILEIIGE